MKHGLCGRSRDSTSTGIEISNSTIKPGVITSGCELFSETIVYLSNGDLRQSKEQPVNQQLCLRKIFPTARCSLVVSSAVDLSILAFKKLSHPSDIKSTSSLYSHYPIRDSYKPTT